MKIFILLFESTRKTIQSTVDLSFISYLVLEVSRIKDSKHDTQAGSLQTTTTTVKIVTSSSLHVDQ